MIQPQPNLKPIDLPIKQKIADHYDRLAADRPRFRARNRYYYRQLIEYLRFIVPPEKRVLEVGCASPSPRRSQEKGRGRRPASSSYPHPLGIL